MYECMYRNLFIVIELINFEKIQKHLKSLFQQIWIVFELGQYLLSDVHASLFLLKILQIFAAAHFMPKTSVKIA